jgi:putative phosphoribosyl transferase
VDEGLVSSEGMEAAVRWARERDAARVLACAPVAAHAAAERLARIADGVACVHVTEHLVAPGAWYDRFPPISDAEVVAIHAAASRWQEQDDAASVPAQPRR